MFYPQNDPLTEEPPHFTDTETEALRGEIKLVQKGKIEKGRQKGREREKKEKKEGNEGGEKEENEKGERGKRRFPSSYNFPTCISILKALRSPTRKIAYFLGLI